MKSYDYIIAGGGLSGMLLAFHLAKSQLKHKKILIIEKTSQGEYQRQWSFWIDHKHPFENVVSHRWKKLDAYFEKLSFTLPLKKYQLQLINSKELFEYISHSFLSLPTIEIINESVETILENKNSVVVTTNVNSYSAEWIFTSIPKTSTNSKSTVTMQGCSWSVHAPDSFKKDTMTFCDYRHSVQTLPGFFYSLPTSESDTIIYYASFSLPSTLNEKTLNKEALNYIENCLGISHPHISSRGLSNYPLPVSKTVRNMSSHVVPIGAAAGLIKPSTSYGFTNILHDSQQLVSQLEKTGSPCYRQTFSLLGKIADKAMNMLVRNNPQKLQTLFKAVFSSIDTGDELLSFLDETASKETKQKIMNGVDPRIFFT